MITYSFENRITESLFIEECEAAGVGVQKIEQTTARKTGAPLLFVTVPEGVSAASLQAVVDSHVPWTRAQEAAEREADECEERAKAEENRARLERAKVIAIERSKTDAVSILDTRIAREDLKISTLTRTIDAR